MKKAIIGFGFLTLTIGLIFCTDHLYLFTVRGIGEMHSLDYNFENYTSLSVSGDFEVVCNDQESDKLIINAQDNILKHIVVKEKNGNIIVGTKSGINLSYSESKRPQIYVSARLLESVNVSGQINVRSIAKITTDKFAIKASGANIFDLNIDVKTLDIDCSGFVEMTLAGTTKDMTIEGSGASDVNAFSLEAKNIKIKTQGSGNYKINCSSVLDVDVSGASNIFYKGNPSVTQSISGAGQIENVE